MKKTLIPYALNILAHLFPFSWDIIHSKNVDVYTLWGGEGSEKVYVLFTHLSSPDNTKISWWQVISEGNTCAV